jgi:hypothetical protein
MPFEIEFIGMAKFMIKGWNDLEIQIKGDFLMNVRKVQSNSQANHIYADTDQIIKARLDR